MRIAAASGAEAIAQISAIINAEVIASEDLVGLVGLLSGSGAYITLMKFAADHHLVNSEGYTFPLSRNERLQTLVNEKINGVAALLPPRRKIWPLTG